MNAPSSQISEEFAASPETPSAPDRARPRSRPSLWFLPPLLALIVLRALLIGDSPTEFPLDRNINAAGRIRHLQQIVSRMPLGLDYLQQVFASPNESPEFPFMPVGAWLLAKTGLPPIVAARLIALAAAVLTGLGLYVLGRRLGPPGLGAAALWLYALNPLAILLGRGLLPDSLMVAAIVWSVVAAGAGRSDARPRAALWMALWLIVAALAKLSALFFAPVAAFALLQALGWRRRIAWFCLALAAPLTYLLVCLWYGIPLGSPWEGLHRISESTNHLMSASPSGLLGAGPLQVIVERCVLALTTPGLILALLGWFFLQIRPGQRLWLNLWLILGFLFIAVTIEANTYWVYALTPVGCLLGGLAVVELWRFGRWTSAPLALTLLLSLWICPSIDKVRTYLLIHPEYETMGEVGRRWIKTYNVFYMGQVPGDIDYFVGRLGTSQPNPQPDSLGRLKSGAYVYFFTNNLFGGGIVGDLFNTKPILETRPGQYILFATDYPVKLGEPLTDDAARGAPLNLELGQALKIVSLQAVPQSVKPGQRLVLEAVFEKGPGYASPPPLALDFIHQPTHLALPLTPLGGGAALRDWSRPLLQTPDFGKAARVRMRYIYQISPHMPAGPYRFNFSLLQDCKSKTAVAQTGPVTPEVLVLPPDKPAAPPLIIQATEGIWLEPIFLNLPPWLGRARQNALLGGSTQWWLRPNLSPGRYELRVTGRAIPTRNSTTDVWPVLSLQKAGELKALELAFTSELRQTVRIPLDWSGAGDFLSLALANPTGNPAPRVLFPLYLGEISGGVRAVEIDRVEVCPAPPEKEK